LYDLLAHDLCANNSPITRSASILRLSPGSSAGSVSFSCWQHLPIGLKNAIRALFLAQIDFCTVRDLLLGVVFAPRLAFDVPDRGFG
jgi:hypothetical protein